MISPRNIATLGMIGGTKSIASCGFTSPNVLPWQVPFWARYRLAVQILRRASVTLER